VTVDRAPAERLRAEFDRIAELSRAGWDHNAAHDGALLRRLPEPCRDALEIGCGGGGFTRLLASRADRVRAVDLSPGMIRLARERCAGHGNVTFVEADVMSIEMPERACDAVVTIATLHHLPLEPMLRRIARTLRPGGRLLAVDLVRTRGITGLAWSGAAWLVDAALRLDPRRPRNDSAALRDAWRAHGSRESYLTLTEAQRRIRRVLPGAEVTPGLFWRYQLVWEKPA
jgi:ubiquinone/menaquinone biosynthesis C-methylase UbiE